MAIIAVLALLYLGVAWLIDDRYYQLILTITPIWAAVGVAWNLFSGYSGLVSFGHAAFFGIGAYTVALLQINAGMSPWIGIPLAGVAGGAAGLLIGYPTFRLRGHYFALAMLAYPLVLLYVFQWLGYQEVTLPMVREAPAAYMQFADQRIYVVLAVLLLIVTLAINLSIDRSRFGLSLRAISENEAAATASGINPLAWKLKAIALSAGLTALAGGLYAVVLLIVTPDSVFGMLASSRALIVTLFGGIGTIAGPVVGALVLIPLGEILHAQLAERLPGIQGVVLGLAIMLIVSLCPQGILPWLQARLRGSATQSSRRALQFDATPFVRESALPAHGAPVLTVRDVAVAFGGVQALREVSFEVHQGEILGVVGPNGAGKTTLFNILNGFTTPSKGSVVFEGRELIGQSAFQVCRAGIGRTFQVMRPFARLSVLDNVVVGAFAHEARDAAAYQKARQALRRAGIADLTQAVAGNLTTIELRLMELARALACGPRLLLLDEILAGLGAGEVEHMLKVIASIRQQGVTIIIIEHTMHAMVRIADRLVVLDHGQVLESGEPQQVINRPSVIEAYLGTRWAGHAAA
jgi:ABC-type branched-subunit amino acid transport system ATPase component/ABC-type branched-subunit amino acid transport system permease subunit